MTVLTINRSLKKKGDWNGAAILSPEAVVAGVFSSESGDRLPEDLIFEVLARVERIKTLHQCKCVSKEWQSIIQGPLFLEAYRSHRHPGGLLLSVAKDDQDDRSCFGFGNDSSSQVRIDFHYSGFVAENPEPFFSRSTVTASHLYKGITNIVDGLACVFEDNRVFVCNVCTGETMSLPDTEFSPSNATGSACYLGYDPTSKAYKLLKINSFETVCTAAELELQPMYCDHLPYRRLECEILTIGRDSTWRKVATVGAPLVRMSFGIFMFEEPLLINGVIYWIMDYLDQPARLISFDVNKEEFVLLKPPRDPLVLPRGYKWGFAQLGGRPALYCSARKPGENGRLAFHTLEDDQGNSWSNHVIPIPPEFETLGSYSSIAVGNLPTGQTLFANIRGVSATFQSNEGYKAIFSYDHQKNKFEKLRVGELSHLICDPVNKIRHFTVTCLEENFAPLDVQLRGGIGKWLF